jgi:cysteine desulfurase
MTVRKIYLDYCATITVHPSVSSQMQRALETDFGNPSVLHWGEDARQLVDHARAEVASGIGCQPGEIIFTSGATRRIICAFGTLRQFPPGKAHLITSTIEHHAILHAANVLSRMDIL